MGYFSRKNLNRDGGVEDMKFTWVLKKKEYGNFGGQLK